MFLVTLVVLLRQRFFSFSAAFNCALIKKNIYLAITKQGRGPQAVQIKMQAALI